MQEERGSPGGFVLGPARACVVFLVVAVVATWPLVLRLGSALPAGAHDLYQNVWNFWWWRTALFDLGTSPFHTTLLFAPEGADLTFHTHSAFNQLITMPVNLLFGHVAAYNTSVVLAVFLCGLGAYLFLREVVGDDTAALGGGLLYTLFPQHLEQLFEHVNLYSCQFIPFTLLFLIRTLRNGRMRDGILTGLFFALNALASWHLGIFLLMIGAPCAVWYGVRSPCRLAALGRLAVGGVLCTLTLLPFLWPMVSGIVSGTAYFEKPLEYRPIDPAFLVVPPPQSTLLGSATEGFYLAHRGNAFDPGRLFQFQYAGFICFLGWIPLLAALVSIVSAIRKRCRGEVLFWLGLFVVFLIFSLGKHLTFMGHTYEGWTLPQGWTGMWPVFRVLRVANRYLIPGSLAFAVLVAIGIARLPKVAVLRWAVVALIPLEFLWVPFPTEPAPAYPFMEELAGRPDTGIVLDIPITTRAAHVDTMLRQTFHRSPIVGGYTACVPPAKRQALIDTPPFAGLSLETVKQPLVRITRSWVEQLREMGIGTIVVEPGETKENLRRHLEERRKEGVLPFFLRRLNPGPVLPGNRVEALIIALERVLGPPLFASEEGVEEGLMVWSLAGEGRGE